MNCLNEEECANWLETHLHPAGLKCPCCGEVEKRIARHTRYWVAYRCKSCDRYYSLLTDMVFEKTRQPPSKIVLMRHHYQNCLRQMIPLILTLFFLCFCGAVASNGAADKRTSATPLRWTPLSLFASSAFQADLSRPAP
jgi:hypothetical protein